MDTRQTRLWLRLFAIFIGYMIASQAGLLLATINQNASPFWPATGFAIFCAITIGNIALLPIGLAAFLTNYLVPSPLPTALLIAIGNALEAFIGYRVFIAVYRRRTLFAHLHEPLATVGATALGALASASFGVTALYYTAGLPKSLTIFSWLTWYSGDIVGGMITLPFLLELRRRLARQAADLPRNALYALLPLALFSTLFNFAQWTTMLFVAFPLALLSLSYGSRMTAVTYLLGVATVCAIGTWFTEGPFGTGNTNINLLYLVLFLFSLALSTVVMISYDRIGVLYGNRRYFIMVWIAAASLTLGFELFSKNVDDDHFRALTRKAEERIAERMDDYTRALSGGVALFRASETVTRDEWRSFAEAFSITSALPGVHGIGFIRSLSAPEIEKFITANRKTGAPYFSVKSLGEVQAHDHFIIQYLEPIDANRSAIGLDIGSESRRRAAAELSRDTGHPAMTESIFLIQDTKTRPGFLLFSPVYRGNETLHTVDDRRRRIVGWVYAPFVTGDFFEHALESIQDELDITVYENGTDKVLWTNRTTAPKDIRLKTIQTVTLAQRNGRRHCSRDQQSTCDNRGSNRKSSRSAQSRPH
ncbi:MAG: CHASE domain-containing protein [Bdellovibrionales bacterium]|nr:CHASE domain-containing protein [Bdellovibrionales bacterium]